MMSQIHFVIVGVLNLEEAAIKQHRPVDYTSFEALQSHSTDVAFSFYLPPVVPFVEFKGMPSMARPCRARNALPCSVALIVEQLYSGT